MGWSISPSDLARIDNNGNVTFSKHTERDITYTITYSDSNFTCTKACTVYKCAEACTCANANLNAAVAPDGVDIPAIGYTTSKTIGTYNFSTCLTAITATSDQDWVTDITVGSGNITAKVSENTSTVSARTATITVTGKDGSGEDCQGTFIVSQQMSATTCICDVFTVSPIEGCVPVSAGTVNIGTYTDGDCVTSISAYNLPNWLSSVGFSNGTISGTVTKNEGTAKREATITVSGTAGSDTCTKDLYVCQSAPGYDCTSFSVVNQEVRYSHDDQGEVAVSTINSNVGAGLFDSLTVAGSGGSSFSGLRTVVNGTSMTIYVTMAECTSDEKYDIIATVNGQTCPIMSLYRICPCVTDNCLQTMTGLDYPLYIIACYEDCWVTLSNGQVVKKRSYTADSPYLSNTDIFGNAALTESIYTGNIAEPIDDVLVFSGMNPDNTVWYSTDWSKYTGWYKDLGYGIHVIYFRSMFVYIADNSGGNSPVSVVSTYYTDGTKTLSGGPWSGKKACSASTTTIVLARNGYGYKKTGPYDPAKGETTYEEYSIGYTCENCGSTPPTPTSCTGGATLGIGSCVSSAATSSAVQIGTWSKTPAGCTDSWSYDSSRSISGTNFINTSSIDFRSDGTIYAIINSTNPSNDTRWCQIPTKLGSVTDYFTITQCAGGSTPPTPTTYTYTVTTDAGGEGANLTFYANVGGSGQAVHTGTISNGSCVFSTDTNYGDVTVIIGKEGCTFTSTSGSNTIAPNGSVAFTSSCSSPPVECTCANAGVSTITARTYDGDAHYMTPVAYFTASCDASFSVSYHSGADIIRNWSVVNYSMGNEYQVYADVQENPGVFSRQETLTLLANGSVCSSFVINQLGNCANAVDYDTSSIIRDYINLNKDLPLTISYPDTGECWTPSIHYLQGGSSVSQENFSRTSVILTFQDNLPISCYLKFTNVKDGRVKTTQTIQITFN